MPRRAEGRRVTKKWLSDVMRPLTSPLGPSPRAAPPSKVADAGGFSLGAASPPPPGAPGERLLLDRCVLVELLATSPSPGDAAAATTGTAPTTANAAAAAASASGYTRVRTFRVEVEAPAAVRRDQLQRLNRTLWNAVRNQVPETCVAPTAGGGDDDDAPRAGVLRRKRWHVSCATASSLSVLQQLSGKRVVTRTLSVYFGDPPAAPPPPAKLPEKAELLFSRPAVHPPSFLHTLPDDILCGPLVSVLPPASLACLAGSCAMLRALLSSSAVIVAAVSSTRRRIAEQSRAMAVCAATARDTLGSAIEHLQAADEATELAALHGAVASFIPGSASASPGLLKALALTLAVIKVSSGVRDGGELGAMQIAAGLGMVNVALRGGTSAVVRLLRQQGVPALQSALMHDMDPRSLMAFHNAELPERYAVRVRAAFGQAGVVVAAYKELGDDPTFLCVDSRPLQIFARRVLRMVEACHQLGAAEGPRVAVKAAGQTVGEAERRLLTWWQMRADARRVLVHAGLGQAKVAPRILSLSGFGKIGWPSVGPAIVASVLQDLHTAMGQLPRQRRTRRRRRRPRRTRLDVK